MLNLIIFQGYENAYLKKTIVRLYQNNFYLFPNNFLKAITDGFLKSF